MEVFPVKFEAYDMEYKMHIFTVEADDESSATVKIDAGVSATSWKEISDAIYKCLVDMKLEGDNNAN